MVSNVGVHNMVNQQRHIGSQTRPRSGASPNLAARSDSAAVSSNATRFSQLIDRYNSLTHINGQQIQQLRAVNNKLTILWNLPYRFERGSSGMLSYILFHSTGTNWSNLFAEIYREIGADGDFFANDIFHQNGNVGFAILSKLAGGAGSNINCMYSPDDIIATLTAAGFEPGWIEIGNGHETHRYYFTRCGTIQTEARINIQRQFWNEKDLRTYGLQEGDKIMVNFEYKTIGADGRIYIPEGVPVIFGATIWFPGQEELFGWSQDENGEWNREHPPFVSILSDAFWDDVVASRTRYNHIINADILERYGNHFATVYAEIVSYAKTLSTATVSNDFHAQGTHRKIAVQRMNQNMSESNLITLGMHLNLVRETMRGTQQINNEVGLESSLQGLTNAFELTHANIIGNPPDDYQNQLNYLEDALLMTVNTLFFRSVKQNDNADFIRDMEDAEIKSKKFTNIFLNHFGEHGVNAFAYAWVALQTNVN